MINNIYFLNNSNKKIVIKKYNTIAKGFNIEFPLTRAIVENNLITYLSSNISLEKIHFPIVLRYIGIPPTLIMEKSNLVPLSQLKPNEYPSVSVWKEFFTFIYSLKTIDYHMVEEIFAGHMDNQEIIKDIMYTIKIKTRNPQLEQAGILCLGDLSPNNILCDKHNICLIDFECSHWGSVGYDLGQFFAMLSILYKKNNSVQYNRIKQCFKNTVKDIYYITKCFEWEKQLIPYYSRGKHE